MFMKKLLYGATLSVAALAAGFTGTSASAGGCYSGGYYYGGGHGGHVSVSVGYRGGHYDYGHRRGGYHHGDRGSRHYHAPRHHHQPAGYYRQVYHPPVYRTYYDGCGYPYRVCVRAGYYERVWVPGCR